MFEEHEVIETVTELTLERVRVFVKQGWVRPESRGDQVVYTDIDVARIRLICQLTDDLSIDEEAVPLVLSLVDQVYGLRRELRNLARVVEDQPDAVRAEITAAFKELSEI
jgi:chaperone modulatory protein CbpM